VTAPAEFTIGEVAAMVGFSPHTLRAWERRHNILKPQRTQSGQRRYTAEDIELLREVISGVVVRGLTLKVAVRAAQGMVTLGPAEPASDRSGARDAQPAAANGQAEPAGGPWRAVADFLPQLVAILDSEGRIVDANVTLACSAGVLREQLRGTRFVDFADPYDRAKAVAAFRPPFRRRQGWELNLRMHSRRGLFSFECIPLKSEGQQLLVLIGHDLSERESAPRLVLQGEHGSRLAGAASRRG
jgi:PAS domain-containing protein